MTKAESGDCWRFGERTRLACWHWRPRQCELLSVSFVTKRKLVQANHISQKLVVARARQPKRGGACAPRPTELPL